LKGRKRRRSSSNGVLQVGKDRYHYYYYYHHHHHHHHYYYYYSSSSSSSHHPTTTPTIPPPPHLIINIQATVAHLIIFHPFRRSIHRDQISMGDESPFGVTSSTTSIGESGDVLGVRRVVGLGVTEPYPL